jgi:hypothetical protein
LLKLPHAAFAPALLGTFAERAVTEMFLLYDSFSIRSYMAGPHTNTAQLHSSGWTGCAKAQELWLEKS